MITLIIGPRGSGKTDLAVEMASESGKRYGVLCPNGAMARILRRKSNASTYSVITKCGDPSWDLVVLDCAHMTSRARALQVIGRLKERGAELIITTRPPEPKSAAWLVALMKSDKIQIINLSRELNAVLDETKNLG